MQLIGFLLAACIALALLRMAVAALLIGLCVLLAAGAIWYPRETTGLLILSAALGLMQLHPALSLIALGLGALLHKDK